MNQSIEKDSDGVFRVSASTNVHNLASAIVHNVTRGDDPILAAMGAGAVNQANKAVAIANQKLASQAVRLYMLPAFHKDTPLFKKDNETEEPANYSLLRFYLKSFKGVA